MLVTHTTKCFVNVQNGRCSFRGPKNCFGAFEETFKKLYIYYIYIVFLLLGFCKIYFVEWLLKKKYTYNIIDHRVLKRNEREQEILRKNIGEMFGDIISKITVDESDIRKQNKKFFFHAQLSVCYVTFGIRRRVDCAHDCKFSAPVFCVFYNRSFSLVFRKLITGGN